MSMLRCFGAYLVKTGEWDRNRLEHVPKSGEVGEIGARALTVEEARRLVWVVKMRVERDARVKASTLREVVVLLKTGWRPSMLYGVRRCDLVLDAKIPHCVTHPSWCKNKRRMTVALDNEAATALREQIEAVPGGPDSPVFLQQTTRATWRSYVGAAGIEYGSKATGHASMYATRKTFATWLDEGGCPDGVRESLLCHFDPYVKPSLQSQHAALHRLPRLLDFFSENRVENGTESGIYSGGGPHNQAHDSSVQPKTRQRNPESDRDRQTSVEVRGLPRFQGCSQPSTEPNPNENGHSRLGQAGSCAVLERVLGLIEAHNDLMRRLLEVCERQGAFDGRAVEELAGDDRGGGGAARDYGVAAEPGEVQARSDVGRA
jgi:hypothetical protein